MPKRILVIVEGEADEVRFLNSIFKNCYKKADYKIYTYKTNIHVLAQELFNNYNDFDDDETDIRLILASLESDKKRRDILLDKYTDIYMIFDFEPHHDHPHFDTVRRMIKYFDDSTNQGKLYINYPMMQSYKHLLKLPDATFKDRKVDMSQIKNYKRIVGEESCYTDLGRYSYTTFYSLAVHHLKKMNMLLNSLYELPSIDDYLGFGGDNIYDSQIEMLNHTGFVYVLNTCIFALVDFAPSKFFKFVNQHLEELDI